MSPKQYTLEGFETTFEQKLRRDNRWVKLAQTIPWDSIVGHYDKLFPSREGRPPISGSVILGTIIIKHLGNLSDRETIAQIAENPYMQYFLGYSSFIQQEPFSATLFVEIRERLSVDLLTRINEVITVDHIQEELSITNRSTSATEDHNEDQEKGKEQQQGHVGEGEQEAGEGLPANKGRLLVDATVAPQDITFPTDLKLLDAARRKSEQLIDKLYNAGLHGKVKPRTYRKIARKNYLNTAKKNLKSTKELYKANGQQLRYLRRNLKAIDTLLESYSCFPLPYKDLRYLMILREVYSQQHKMYRNRDHMVADRIVSIHQPHIRPIVRGKEKAKTEFGSKIHVSMVSGFTFIDHLSWDAFNEGSYLIYSVEAYKRRMGFYPSQVHADRIYCTRENRRWLKEKGIRLMAKPLGRPSAEAVKNHVSPGERNPIEGKFGQGKLKYGWDNIRAKLQTTSESWVVSIALLLNLVRLTRQAPLSQTLRSYLAKLTISILEYQVVIKQRRMDLKLLFLVSY